MLGKRYFVPNLIGTVYFVPSSNISSNSFAY